MHERSPLIGQWFHVVLLAHATKNIHKYVHKCGRFCALAL
jgi:hypothetical protein